MKTSIRSLAISTLVISGFALLFEVQAVVPPSNGGYPGGNTAEGDNALLRLTSGINNTAVGANALRDNTTGYYNVAIGSGALASNIIGQQNMAIGTEALTNINANFNVAIDFRAGYMNTIGHHLTGIGAGALRNNTEGTYNTAIGADALRENDGSANTAVGVAEDVEKVNPDLVVRDKEGKPYTVRYDAVNAMLLNEFLKAHRKIEEQDQTISQLKAGMDALTATVKEQATQIQKVSAQFQMSRPASQVTASK